MTYKELYNFAYHFLLKKEGVTKKLNLINPNEKSTIKQDYQTLKLIDRIALENYITAFEVDKIFWLKGRGNFYLSNIQIGRNRNQFIEQVKNHFNL